MLSVAFKNLKSDEEVKEAHDEVASDEKID